MLTLPYAFMNVKSLIPYSGKTLPYHKVNVNGMLVGDIACKYYKSVYLRYLV